jgi:hypothetical protein
MANSVNLDTSSRLDITCRKGDTFRLILTLTDAAGAALDATTYDFKMEVRDSDTAASTVVADTDVTYTKASGQLTVVIDEANMDMDGGLYVYDIQASKSGDVQTWLHGLFKVNEDVTV